MTEWVNNKGQIFQIVFAAISAIVALCIWLAVKPQDYTHLLLVVAVAAGTLAFILFMGVLSRELRLFFGIVFGLLVGAGGGFFATAWFYQNGGFVILEGRFIGPAPVDFAGTVSRPDFSSGTTFGGAPGTTFGPAGPINSFNTPAAPNSSNSTPPANSFRSEANIVGQPKADGIGQPNTPSGSTQPSGPSGGTQPSGPSGGTQPSGVSGFGQPGGSSGFGQPGGSAGLAPNGGAVNRPEKGFVTGSNTNSAPTGSNTNSAPTGTNTNELPNTFTPSNAPNTIVGGPPTSALPTGITGGSGTGVTGGMGSRVVVIQHRGKVWYLGNVIIGWPP